jgi:C_GCAxxG_C_C family probable redox protein
MVVGGVIFQWLLLKCEGAMSENKSKAGQAVKCFVDGFNCSQSLLSTYGPQFGLDTEMSLKISSPFGGGIGHMGETCGALTGAFMVLGLRSGRTKVDDKEAQERVYKLVAEFVEKFEERNGSVICRDLLGYDLSKPEDLKLVKAKGITRAKCPKFVKDSAEILEGMLQRS